MGYYRMTYFNSLKHSDMAKKQDLNGTSVSDEKGTDNKANNTSAYNHDYYMKNKEKWKDNDSDDNPDSATSEEKEFDLDAAALDVIRGKYGNGQARKDALGDDFDMVQKRVNEMYAEGRFGGGTKTVASEEQKEEQKKASSSSDNSWYTKSKRKIEEAQANK